MSRMEGKVGIVTGAASGIGESSARLLVSEGARVVVADIQDEAGRALADELGDAAHYVHTDVTRESDLEAVVAQALERYGRLDFMFNNAGGFGGRGSITELSEEAFDSTVGLLLKSVFFGMKHAGRVLSEQRSGCILSTASIAGLIAGGGPHLYSTAKAAVIQLTRSVALELGEQNVRVNCICPGGVPTPFVLGAVGLGEDAKSGIEAAMAKTQPIPRAGSALDIARAALWLCSDDADYVTGQAITVDGGEATGQTWSKQYLK